MYAVCGAALAQPSTDLLVLRLPSEQLQKKLLLYWYGASYRVRRTCYPE